MADNFYDILGLRTFESNPKKIKKAYRSRINKLDPNRYQNRDSSKNRYRLIEVNEAYLVLSDCVVKSLYDKAIPTNDYDNAELSDLIEKKREKAKAFVNSFFNGTQKKKHRTLLQKIIVAILALMTIGCVLRYVNLCIEHIKQTPTFFYATQDSDNTKVDPCQFYFKGIDGMSDTQRVSWLAEHSDEMGKRGYDINSKEDLNDYIKCKTIEKLFVDRRDVLTNSKQRAFADKYLSDAPISVTEADKMVAAFAINENESLAIDARYMYKDELLDYYYDNNCDFYFSTTDTQQIFIDFIDEVSLNSDDYSAYKDEGIFDDDRFNRSIIFLKRQESYGYYFALNELKYEYQDIAAASQSYFDKIMCTSWIIFNSMVSDTVSAIGITYGLAKALFKCDAKALVNNDIIDWSKNLTETGAWGLKEQQRMRSLHKKKWGLRYPAKNDTNHYNRNTYYELFYTYIKL